MMGFVRLALFLFVFLTILYVTASVYLRSVRREQLEKRWDSRAHPLLPTTDRAEFIRRGLHLYDRSLRRRLLLAIYVVPVTLIAVLLYLINFA
jgi:hypothetical protein